MSTIKDIFLSMFYPFHDGVIHIFWSGSLNFFAFSSRKDRCTDYINPL